VDGLRRVAALTMAKVCCNSCMVGSLQSVVKKVRQVAVSAAQAALVAYKQCQEIVTAFSSSSARQHAPDNWCD
jgi:hypothetical protein